MPSSEHIRHNFHRERSYASAVLLIVILSVRLSVTRVLCDETKEHTLPVF